MSQTILISADDYRNVRALDVALNGEKGAAKRPLLTDALSQVQAEVRRLGRPLLVAQVPTTAWLVEWRFNGVQWLYLWASAPGGFSFTGDASKALRFARREDAEAALQWARDTDAARRPIGSLTRHGLAMGEMLVTEHEWLNAETVDYKKER